MLKQVLAAAAIAAISWTSGAQAETCGGVYRVKGGDSLSAISDSLYKNAGMWTLIYQNNNGSIGAKPSNIRVGMKLKINCIGGLPLGLPGGTEVTNVVAQPRQAASPGTAAGRKKINILVGDGIAPLFDKKLPNGGLLVDLMQNLMDAADPQEGFAIHVVDDFKSLLDPLLSNTLLDLGMPWFKPDCEADPENYRCVNFDFSDPMFELLVLLFIDKKNPMKFTQDSDMVGKTMCRQAGIFTHDLDAYGRNWLREKKITLVRPRGLKACFQMLLDGEVDVVSIDEFAGRQMIKEMDVKGRIEPLSTRPLSIEAFRVLVHKTHPRKGELIDMVNKGLNEIRENGKYQEVIDTHMTRIWAGF